MTTSKTRILLTEDHPSSAVLLTAHDEESISPSARDAFACCLMMPVELDRLEHAILDTCGG